MNDKEFLTWIHGRLQHAHGVNPNVDYMHQLRSIVNKTDPNQETPNICNTWETPDSDQANEGASKIESLPLLGMEITSQGEIEMVDIRKDKQ